MKAKIDMLGLITPRFEAMRDFYRDVMGFRITLELDNHIEFESEGVRFALSTPQVMASITEHPSYQEKKAGQSFELAFRSNSPAEVDKDFDALLKKGAVAVKAPADMPWNQRTAFFADPDGNIHEIFADIQSIHHEN